MGGFVTDEAAALASNEEGVLCHGAPEVVMVDPNEVSTGLRAGVMGGGRDAVGVLRRVAIDERRSCKDGRGECPRIALAGAEEEGALDEYTRGERAEKAGKGADGAVGDSSTVVGIAVDETDRGSVGTTAAAAAAAFSRSRSAALRFLTSASPNKTSSSSSFGALPSLSTSLTYAKHSSASLFLASTSLPSPLCSSASTDHVSALPSFLFASCSREISRSTSKRVRGSQGGRSSVARETCW